jgi:hypothetical protein
MGFPSWSLNVVGCTYPEKGAGQIPVIRKAIAKTHRQLIIGLQAFDRC